MSKYDLTDEDTPGYLVDELRSLREGNHRIIKSGDEITLIPTPEPERCLCGSYSCDSDCTD